MHYQDICTEEFNETNSKFKIFSNFSRKYIKVR